MNSYHDDISRVAVPHNKMGIKILSDMQLSNIFPTYKMLLDRIEMHRRALKHLDRELLKRDNQYNLMFDNIFSIMGGRGAGKTSVVFTIKEKLKDDENNRDIVLPIVMPEMIPSECSIIGWILSLLEEDVKKYDKARGNNQSDEPGKFSGCRKSTNKSLVDLYERTKDLCYAQYYNARQTENFTDAVINTNRMTQNTYDFSKKLIEFWDMLVDAKKAATVEEAKRRRSSEDVDEPLIHIIFDDVDLVPEAAIKLFSTIIKYLSHPNIIVYVTADEKLLFDVIENNMTRRLEKVDDLVMYNHVIGGLKREYDDEDTKDLQSFNKDINKVRKKIVAKEELIHETPKRYGEKVLPPSCRYYLETFESIDKKKDFLVYSPENSVKADDDVYTIQQYLIDEIHRYLIKIGKKEEDNFVILQRKDEPSGSKAEEPAFISAYLLFWGTTSRQLTNEIFILKEFFNRLIEIHNEFERNNCVLDSHNKGVYCRSIYQTIKDFAYTTLIASGNLVTSTDEIQRLLEDLLIYDEENGGVYIDYLYLRDRAQQDYENRHDEDMEEGLKEAISLFVLAFFIESILVIENDVKKINNPDREKVHGMGLLVDVLDYFVGTQYSLVCKKLFDDMPTFLWYYGRLFDKPQIMLRFDLNEPRLVRSYFSVIPSDYNIDKKIAELYRTSPIWVNTITQMLYFADERIYNLTRREVDVVRFNRGDYYFYDLYYGTQYSILVDKLVDALSSKGDFSENASDRYKELYSGTIGKSGTAKSIEENFPEVLFMKGETLGNLAERLRGDLSQPEFEHFCAKIGPRYNEIPFPNEFGTPDCTGALLQELEKVREATMKCFYRFSKHVIYDLQEVIAGLARISVRGIIGIEELQIEQANNSQADGPKEDTPKADNSQADNPKVETKVVISTRYLHTLFSQMAEVDKKNKKNYRFSVESLTEWSQVVNSVYYTVLNNVTSVILNENEHKNAVRAVVLFNYYAYTLSIFIRSFREQTRQSDYNQINIDMIPYIDLYNDSDAGIKKCLESDDYLGMTLRQGIRDKIREYINRFSIGSD